MEQAMPENSAANTNTSPKSSTFRERREDILNRLSHIAKQCQKQYGGRKELATDKDDVIVTLCECLEEAFTYGLKQQAPTAMGLFQNVQEIVSVNIGIGKPSTHDQTFWDFCQKHLSAHERERFENLQHISSKHGRGKAFIRDALNENSLHRYILTWLSTADELVQYYSPWSLLIDPEAAILLPSITSELNTILFALPVDTPETEVNFTRTSPVRRGEPIIFAPTPTPVAAPKKKSSAIERPICSAVEVLDEVIPRINGCQLQTTHAQSFTESAPFQTLKRHQAPDPIEPELEFLKNPITQFYLSNDEEDDSNNSSSELDACYRTEDERSETSSQYSKSSSAISHSKTSTEGITTPSISNSDLEEKLRQLTERCAVLETRNAELSLQNRQLIRRLTQSFKDSGIDPTSSLTSNYLITIPQVKLLKSMSGHGKYYAYEIHVTMRQHLEHWMILRRYRDFYKLHKSLKASHPSVGAVDFPPKKHFGNMNLVFVEERRQQLQIYLISLIEMLPQVEACKTKHELVKIFPFFKER